MVLSGYPSLLLELPSSSTENQTGTYNCVWIIEASIISPSRIGIPYHWLESHWTGWVEHGGLPSLTWPIPTIEWGSEKVTNGRRPLGLDTGHFECQVMPFGLINAPATFQGYINKILAEKLDVFVIVYLDDILIYTENEAQGHVEEVRWVLEQLREHSLYANLKKCWFHQKEVRFLG